MILSREGVDDSVIKKIKDGAVFVYPTDTIYGLGCDASNPTAVNRLRDIKKRDQRPMSVIAPSKEWIRSHLHTDEHTEEWIDKLPGPYTLIINTERGLYISEVIDCVNPGGTSLGVRIPDHWISELVEKIGLPIVTTSANLSGQPNMTSLDNLDPSIKEKVDFIIDEGVIDGEPSEKIFLSEGGDVTRDNVSDM